MSIKKQWYLLCYDIADPKRLSRIHRLMKNEGIPLQYSVFLLQCSLHDALLLMGKLKEMIEAKKDDIRLYPVTSNVDCIALGRKQIGDGIPFTGGSVLHLDGREINATNVLK